MILDVHDLEHQQLLIESAALIAAHPDCPEKKTIMLEALQGAEDLYEQKLITFETKQSIFIALLGS